jgi:hypothetical protein
MPKSSKATLKAMMVKAEKNFALLLKMLSGG